MTIDEFKEGFDTIGGFIEKLVKVFKDLFLFLKDQFSALQK